MKANARLMSAYQSRAYEVGRAIESHCMLEMQKYNKEPEQVPACVAAGEGWQKGMSFYFEKIAVKAK